MLRSRFFDPIVKGEGRLIKNRCRRKEDQLLAAWYLTQIGGLLSTAMASSHPHQMFEDHLIERLIIAIGNETLGFFFGEGAGFLQQ